MLTSFVGYGCWRGIVSLCRSAVTGFSNSIAKMLYPTNDWATEILDFCWIGKPRFLGSRNRSLTIMLFSRLLNTITDRRRNPASCWKPAVRIVVLVSAPVGSNARWTRQLTKVAALGSQLMCWYLIPIRSKELWRFPGSQRFSRSWTSERLVFGVKCASDRRHKQTRLTAKTFLLLNGQKLVSLGAEIYENFSLTPMFCFRLLNSTNRWRNPASSSKTVTKR